MGQVSPLYATLTPTPYVIPIANGSGLLDEWVTPALSNPMTTAEDLIVGGFGGAPTRLGVGPVGYVLTVGSGGIVDWDAATGGFSNPMTTNQDIIVGGVGGTPGRLGVGSVGKVLTVGSGGIIDWETPAAAGGTVTTVSVVSANGFAGSVANPTTTPAITLTTTITGVLKGNGTAISAASAGTDYVAPGAITTSGLTMATAKMLGRATAGTGAIEEIAVTGSGSAVLATAPTFPSTMTIGAASGTTGAINFKGTTSGTVTLSVADAAGTNTFKLPATAGSNTNVLATDGSGNLFWQSAGTGTGTVNSGTATNFAYYASTGTAVSGTGTMTVSSTGRLTMTPTATSSGVVSYLTITGPLDTAMTAGTEAIGINITQQTGAGRQFAGSSGVGSQREIYIHAPTYSFAGGAATITNAATLAIEAAPTAGTNATITNNAALWLVAGNLMMGSGVAGASLGVISQSSGNLTIAGAAGINLNPSRESTGIVSLAGTSGNADLVLSDSTSTRTWQGSTNAGFNGVYVQQAGGNVPKLSLLCVGAGLACNLEGNIAGGSYGSLSAAASGGGIGMKLNVYTGAAWAASKGILSIVTTETQSSTAQGCEIVFYTTKNTTTTRTLNAKVTNDGQVVCLNPTGGIGYGTGAGGTVTQGTSRTTGVTLDKVCGQITLVSAAGTATWQTFTVTNAAVAANDLVDVVQKSGTDLYMIFVTNVAAGSFKITFATTGGTTTEQPVFTFAVTKVVTS